MYVVGKQTRINGGLIPLQNIYPRRDIIFE